MSISLFVKVPVNELLDFALADYDSTIAETQNSAEELIQQVVDEIPEELRATVFSLIDAGSLFGYRRGFRHGFRNNARLQKGESHVIDPGPAAMKVLLYYGDRGNYVGVKEYDNENKLTGLRPPAVYDDGGASAREFIEALSKTRAQQRG